MNDPNEVLSPHRRPTSTKTRIETWMMIILELWNKIADRHPLKQGLKQKKLQAVVDIMINPRLTSIT
jgi:hypothetical protein